MAMEGLSSICAGLGCVDEDSSGKRVGYTKGAYCLDNLKDLVRFLRRDDPQTREVFKQVCKWNIAANDLIPIIEQYHDDRDLVLNSVKVLVFLSMPIEPSSTDINEQLEYLWNLKSVITKSDAIAVIVSLLEVPLENLERDSLTEDDRKLIQLVMTLFRNILAVQEILTQQKADGSANLLLSLRDSFLALLFHENVMDLILVLTQHVGGYRCHLQHDSLLLMDIFHHIFKGQDPEVIARVHRGSKVNNGAKDSTESLKSIMKEEVEKKKMTRLHSLPRHSQFSGTFARFTMDGSKALCKGTPASCSKLAKSKVHRGASKRVVWDQKRQPVVDNDTLFSLHDFLNQFISGAYNVLMQSVRVDIEKDHHAIHNSDVLVFFELAQFVTSFQYYKSIMSKPHGEDDMIEAADDCDGGNNLFRDNICGPIAETLNQSMFELVISKWRYAFDCLKETNDYKFLSTAGSLVKIMIRVLDLVLKTEQEGSKEHQTACTLLYQLFYDQTDQGLTQYLFNLIKSFDTHKQPKSDLADLVEIVHIILRRMENFQRHGTLRVSRKARRRSRKNHEGIAKDADGTQENQPPIKSESNENNPNATATEGHLDMSNSQMENSGKSGLGTDLMHHTDALVIEKEDTTTSVPSTHKRDSDVTAKADCLMDGASNGESSGDEQTVETAEVDLKFTTLLNSLVTNNTIKNICWLLKFYKSNSVSTNHYLICMLRRICDDLNLTPMLYELSYLCTFYDILDEQKSCPHKDYKNIVDFLTTLVRRLLRKMASQPLLFVEVLFSKTRRDCHFISTESMIKEIGDMKNEVKNWNGTSAHGEASQIESKKRTVRSMADALGDDEFDVPMPNEPFDDKEDDLEGAPEDLVFETGKEFANELGKGSSRPQNDWADAMRKDNIAEPSTNDNVKRGGKLRKRIVFNDELVEKLRDLYEKHKHQKRCSHMIATALSPEGEITSAQVSRKLNKLGLCNRKQVHEENLLITDEDCDNAPLSSLRKRRSDKDNTARPDREASTGKESAAHSSDDEILSSILVKSKSALKRTDKVDASVQQPSLAGKQSESDYAQGSIDRGTRIQGTEVQAAVNNRHADFSSESPNGSPKRGTDGFVDDADVEGNHLSGNELFDYELSPKNSVDFDDETAPTSSSQGSSFKRRKLRMVIDVEDDDE